MCTALLYRGDGYYFGRNLDLEEHYGEQPVITPRNVPLPMRGMPALSRHYAMAGMAWVQGGYPLYYDGFNEHGLAVAGLNFPGYAAYHPFKAGADNVTPFELIPWLLGTCADVGEVRAALGRVNLLGRNFTPELPLTPMHFLAADKKGRALVIEPMEQGVKLWDAPAGILTNAPPFDWQMTNLARYRGLSPVQPEDRMGWELPLFSNGMGALGLPGDLSSPSRFVRGAFALRNAVPGKTPEQSMTRVFHILAGVAQSRGCVTLPEGGTEQTVYALCFDLERGRCCYTTEENSRPTGIDLFKANLEGDTLVAFPLRRHGDILWEN